MRTLVSVLVVLIMCCMSAVFICRRREAPLARRYLYLMLPLGQIALVSFMLWYTTALHLPAWLFGLVAIVGLTSVPLYVVLFGVLREAEKKELATERVRLLEEQLEAQRERCRSLDVDREAARLIRSDVIAKLKEVDDLLQKKETAEVREGLGRAVDLMDPVSPLYCRHRSLDALIALKAKACEEAGVCATFALDVPEDLPIPSVELCAVFSNMLDNAIRACRELRLEDRLIDMRAYSQSGFFTIDMTNGCAGKNARVSSERYLRGKRFGQRMYESHGGRIAEHGWGLSIINGIAERHEGIFLIEMKKGEFRMTVMLGLGDVRCR